METEAPFPLVESVVIAHLEAALSVAAGTSTPSNLEKALPFLRVTAGPGSDDGTTDSPLVDVEAFAATRHAAATLAEDARQAMLALSARNAGGALVDSVTTASRPSWVDYKNPAIQRYVAAYRLALRRPR